MENNQWESQMSETTAEKHLRKDLNEADLSEENYHIRVALQYMLSEEAGRYSGRF